MNDIDKWSEIRDNTLDTTESVLGRTRSENRKSLSNKVVE